VTKTIILYHPRTFHEKNYRYYYIPYSLLSLTTNIDLQRYRLHLVDNNVHRRADWSSWLADLDEPPLCVGISSMIGAQIGDALAFARAVGEVFPGVPRIWGGALPTVLPELTAAHRDVDIAVVGQGQETFAEVLHAMMAGADLSSVAGLSFRRDEGVHHTAPRPLPDLNRFRPFRDVYHLLDVQQYVRVDEHINQRTINYHSSQGCPFSCGFCSEVALWNRKWSGLTPDRILTDLEFLADNYQINGIKFYDAEFFIRRDRVLEFARQVEQRRLDLRWAAAVHPRNLDRLSDAELALLSRSGASRLLMGAESGVQDELNLINKKTDREMLLRLARRCAEHGLVASFSFVTGYPGSTGAHIEASLDFAAELHAAGPEHEAKVHFYAPYPGTPLYPMALKHGFVPPRSLEEWCDYDYYYITTPWVDSKYEEQVRQFNEAAYPYLHPAPEPDATTERICPIIR
jgi:radical SAM superfamily enzyme YgiQ (UPF0313 family)